MRMLKAHRERVGPGRPGKIPYKVVGIRYEAFFIKH